MKISTREQPSGITQVIMNNKRVGSVKPVKVGESHKWLVRIYATRTAFTINGGVGRDGAIGHLVWLVS